MVMSQDEITSSSGDAKKPCVKAKKGSRKKPRFDVEKALAALMSLPLNPEEYRLKNEDARRRFQRENAPTVEKLLASGWTPNRVAKALQSQGVPISAAQIKTMHENYAKARKSVEDSGIPGEQSDNADKRVAEQGNANSGSPRGELPPPKPPISRRVATPLSPESDVASTTPAAFDQEDAEDESIDDFSRDWESQIG
jgi:hypothetical protein